MVEHVYAVLYDGVTTLEHHEDRTQFPADARDDSGGATEFMWTEGNYSCDCNRRLFMFRAVGKEPSNEERDQCGDKIELVSLRVVLTDGSTRYLVGQQS